MNEQELEAALAECEGHTPGPWIAQRYCVWHEEQYVAGVTTGGKLNHEADARLIALAPTLADAVRELREEKKKAYKAGVIAGKALASAEMRASLDQALNENEGVYRP